MTAKSLQQILREGKSGTAELLARSELHTRLARRLSGFLPGELRGRVRLALLEADRVVLVTESAVWKARLRFHLPQIKRLVRSALARQTAKVEIKISPCLDDKPPLPRRQRGLSERSADHLRQAARAIDDNELGRALTRLAGRARDEG